MMELVAGGLAGDFGRHGYDYDHLGDSGGAFACLEEDVGQFGGRDYFQAEEVLVEGDCFLFVASPEDDFGDSGDHGHV